MHTLMMTNKVNFFFKQVLTLILPLERIGATPSNPRIIWRGEGVHWYKMASLKIPNKKKEESTSQKAKQKLMSKEKSKCTKEGYAKRGAIKTICRT